MYLVNALAVNFDAGNLLHNMCLYGDSFFRNQLFLLIYTEQYVIHSSQDCQGIQERCSFSNIIFFSHSISSQLYFKGKWGYDGTQKRSSFPNIIFFSFNFIFVVLYVKVFACQKVIGLLVLCTFLLTLIKMIGLHQCISL